MSKNELRTKCDNSLLRLSVRRVQFLIEPKTRHKTHTVGQEQRGICFLLEIGYCLTLLDKQSYKKH